MSSCPALTVHITGLQHLNSHIYWLNLLRTRTGEGEQLHQPWVVEALFRSLLTRPAWLQLLQVACENVSLESVLQGRVPREPECWPVCLFTCFTISKPFLVDTDWCPGNARIVGTGRTHERQLHGKPVPTAFAFSGLSWLLVLWRCRSGRKKLCAILFSLKRNNCGNRNQNYWDY